MAKFKAGWAEVSITPDKKISLAGQFYERISEYVETPITATALAIESEGEQAILCSCDLTSIAMGLVERVREKVAEKEPEIDISKIIINATHTHTSHTYKATADGANVTTTKDILNRYIPEEQHYKPLVSAKGDDYLKPADAVVFLIERISEAICKAWKNRKPAGYAQGFGRAAVGMCRRVCYSDGSAKMWGDANSAAFTQLEGGNDSGIEMLFFYDENKKLTGAAVNVNCPSQILEHRSFISSDYWGKVKMFLREKYGDDLFVLSLGGPGGDQCPRDLIRWVNPDTPINDPHVERPDYIERIADPSMFEIKGTIKAGKRIAREVIDAIEEVEEIKTDAPFVHKTITLDMPLRRVTPKEFEEAEEKIKSYAEKLEGNANFADNARMYVYAGTILRYEEQHTMNVRPIEVHVLRFGDMAIATNPYELFLDYGNQIRARSRAKQTTLIQLCNGAEGYLPTEKAEKAGHYSAYVTSGKTGHEGGDLLVRKTLEEINSMF